MFKYPTCGCLGGDDYTGFIEVRSSYCMAEERRHFGMAYIITKRVSDAKKREDLLSKVRNRDSHA